MLRFTLLDLFASTTLFAVAAAGIGFAWRSHLQLDGGAAVIIWGCIGVGGLGIGVLLRRWHLDHWTIGVMVAVLIWLVVAMGLVVLLDNPH